MSTSFDAECRDCNSGEQRFLAEFKWNGENDVFAENRFKDWGGLFGPHPEWPTICKENTQAYYLVGTRTFWIISCAQDEAEIRRFCNYIVKDSNKIKYCYYQCLKPGEPGAPAKLKLG